MKWFKENYYEKVPKLPTIEEISTEIPSVSEHLDAFRLAEAFKLADSDTIPVIDTDGSIIGIVSEYDLAKVVPEWSFADQSYTYDIKVSDIMTGNVWTETVHTNLETILSKIHKMHIRVVPIVDENRIYTGKSITRTALIRYLAGLIKPASLGGLATPIGVYMTDGKHQAGAGNLGLVLTGFILAVIISVVQLASGILYSYTHVLRIFLMAVEFLMFLAILRLTPLVRIHAAEHQTINAIEKGLPLTRATVRMQSRVHKRCGTNIMVLLIGIQFIILLSYQLELTKNPFLQFLFLIIGFLFIFSNWKQIGTWMQKYCTTAEASDSQIDNGIKTGEEILKKHKEDTNPRPLNFWDKIWTIGLIQILGSFILTLWIFDLFIKSL